MKEEIIVSKLNKGRWLPEERRAFLTGFRDLTKVGYDLTTGPSDPIWTKFQNDYVNSRKARQIQVHCKKYINTFCRNAYPCTMEESDVWIKCLACQNVFTKATWAKEDIENHKYSFICVYCKEDPMVQSKLKDMRMSAKNKTQQELLHETQEQQKSMIQEAPMVKQEVGEEEEINQDKMIDQETIQKEENKSKQDFKQNLEAPMRDDRFEVPPEYNVRQTRAQRAKLMKLLDEPENNEEAKMRDEILETSLYTPEGEVANSSTIQNVKQECPTTPPMCTPNRMVKEDEMTGTPPPSSSAHRTDTCKTPSKKSHTQEPLMMHQQQKQQTDYKPIHNPLPSTPPPILPPSTTIAKLQENKVLLAHKRPVVTTNNMTTNSMKQQQLAKKDYPSRSMLPHQHHQPQQPVSSTLRHQNGKENTTKTSPKTHFQSSKRKRSQVSLQHPASKENHHHHHHHHHHHRNKHVLVPSVPVIQKESVQQQDYLRSCCILRRPMYGVPLKKRNLFSYPRYPSPPANHSS